MSSNKPIRRLRELRATFCCASCGGRAVGVSLSRALGQMTDAARNGAPPGGI